MQNAIPNIYEKVVNPFWNKLTGRLPKFYYTSARLYFLPQNRQCHQIMTIYFSSSRVYRSFTGKRQHFEIRNAGEFAELGVELHFLYCFS